MKKTYNYVSLLSLISEVNYHLHSGYIFGYCLLPPSLLQQNFCPDKGESRLHTNGLHSGQHSSAPFLKKEDKASKGSLSISMRKDSINADLFDQFRSQCTRSKYTGAGMIGKYLLNKSSWRFSILLTPCPASSPSPPHPETFSFWL